MSALVVTSLRRKCQRTRNTSSASHGTRVPCVRESRSIGHSIGMPPHFLSCCCCPSKRCSVRSWFFSEAPCPYQRRRPCCQVPAGADGNGCCSIVGAPLEVRIRCARVRQDQGGARITKRS